MRPYDPAGASPGGPAGDLSAADKDTHPTTPDRSMTAAFTRP
ncbi:hypothetical protein JOC24_005142 [Streptomyces sp. HB132]|nr:hypothetical protein [Streptomyces sp. HB132]